MKKFLALLLALVMAFSLVACGGDKTPADSRATTTAILSILSTSPAWIS